MVSLTALASAALALAPFAQLASALQEGEIQFNVTIPASHPFLGWMPGLATQKMIDENDGKKNASDFKKKQNLLYWRPAQDADHPAYYFNFTSLQDYKGAVDPPSVVVTGFGNDITFWGKYQDWNTSESKPYALRYKDETKEIDRVEAIATMDRDNNLGTNILGRWVNMTDYEQNTVTLVVNPNLQGGIAMSVEQVTFTTTMKLQVKKPSWKESVNETEIAFVKDGNKNYIDCGDVNNGAVDITGKCDIPIPKDASYIILYGNLSPKGKRVKFKGLEIDHDMETWAAGFFNDQVLVWQPLRFKQEYTLHVDGDVSLTKMKVYSQIKHSANLPKIPWIIVGPAVGGGIVLIAVAAVLYRFIAMGLRRKRRNSMLELRRMSTAESARAPGTGSYQPLLGNAAPPGVDTVRSTRSVSQSYAEDFELGGQGLMDTQSRSVSGQYSEPFTTSVTPPPGPGGPPQSILRQ